MAYGHAERNLALLRQLEAETRQILESLDQPDPEQSALLQEVARFTGTPPTVTRVEVSRLWVPGALLEVEVLAIT